MNVHLLKVTSLALLQTLFVHGEDASVAVTNAISAVSSLRGSQYNHHKSHCYNLYSEMAFNSILQSFNGRSNPDSMAKGFATCKLCTDGAMTCNANVYGGKSPLIASHIHIAKDGDGENGSGPPVVNFCGTGGSGMINDDTDYTGKCAMYNSNGNSINKNMKGAQVMSNSDGQNVEELVMDIGNNPEKYYLNFHSIASWTLWIPDDPKGMCRGVMKSSSLDLEKERD